MKSYLSIFQIGPVQEFIQTAKKTIDYWSGSFLLSYFCAVAINTIGKDNVIFPSVDNNPLFSEVLRPNNSIPWKNINNDKVFRPTIPNRLFCILDESGLNSLKNAKDAVNNQWKQIQSHILKKLPANIKTSEFQTIWHRQVESLFEILYVWRKQEDNESYSEAYKKCETLMGSRKVSRWFDEITPEPGHKCSICGIRESLHLEKKHYTLKTLREEWKTFWQNIQYDLLYAVNEGEMLCSICLIKRLAPKLIFDNRQGVPSTSTIAVGSTVQYLLQKTKELKEFKGAVEDVARLCKEPTNVMQLPKNTNDTLKIDGRWYYREFYQQLRLKDPELKDPNIGNLLCHAEEELEKVLKYNDDMHSCPPPSKYYAVLTVDGDSIGKTLANIDNKDNHKNFSKVLAEFSNDTAFKILQENHLGYVIYFGGDEGVAFLTLQDLFPAMSSIYEAWKNKVITPLKKILDNPPTLSVGVTIAHHQEGLRGVIENAHKALEYAKTLPDKNAFCVCLSRRSSGKSMCRAKWELNDFNNNNFSVMEILKIFQQAYIEGSLSASWINEFSKENKAIGDPSKHLNPQRIPIWLRQTSEMGRWEISRIIKRHRDISKISINTQNIIEQAIRLYQSLRFMHPELGITQNRNFFSDFINLMDLAHYVAKGGGR
ncbi:MAG: type III-B CRISPR-associated protein Cas10/Cmr2 [Desulfobacterales bacterium]|nr:type III-B CRISPR-associated protein Cas10/Cmr2 [Desulfobacterales bacterium]